MDTSGIARILEDSDNFLLLTHKNPDGDAIGSLLGLLNALREIGKNVDGYFHEKLPANYARFADIPALYENLPDFGRYDIVVCLDFSNPERFGPQTDFSRYNVVNIDHHPDNNRFGSSNFVLPEAAATAEIVFNVLNDMDSARISRKTATFLMIGLIMDTGGFRFDNTIPSVFSAASELLSLGADYHAIIDAMFFSKSADFAKMEAEVVLHHLRTGCDGRFAWFYLSDMLLDAYGVDEKNTEGLIEAVRSIENFKIVAIFRRKDNGFRFSLRSKDGALSVGIVARELNGGGHELAAGGFIPSDTIEEAEGIMLERVSKLFADAGAGKEA
ncbi:MAG: bifunctional oligoribonuclease/PAP phosphatase NrnA [Kiritimatiellaeota bacterium]|nr:bifunctional oligoribonuclease/PAP phosphatase NrnA [Kiritimatiellota bacterium]